MNKLKRAAAFLSVLVMLAAVTPELPVKILNESYSITASAETTFSDELKDDTKALTGTQQNDFMAFSDGADVGSFNVKGYYNGVIRKTTYRDLGYETWYKIGDNSKQKITGFVNGKVYEEDGVQFRVKLEFIKNGRSVLITYDMFNKNDQPKDVKIGSCADTMVGNNDKADVIYKDGGWVMEDTAPTIYESSNDSYGARFILKPVDEFSTLWAGHYLDASSNVFTDLRYDYNQKEDSGMAWSYDATLDPGTGVRKQCEITIDSAFELGDVTLTAMPNEKKVQAVVPYSDKQGHTQILYFLLTAEILKNMEQRGVPKVLQNRYLLLIFL